MVKSLQLGLHWFPENHGGLDRVYYELWRSLPMADIAFTGLVAGTGRCNTETQGAIQAFAEGDAPLLARWKGMRQAYAKAVRENPPDLVVSHFALYTLPVLGKLGNLPLVVHFHGPWANEGGLEGNTGLRRAVKIRIENLVYRRASRAIVLSNAFADLLASQYKFPRERVHVIPGGVDLARFDTGLSREEARARLGWPGDRPIIVSVRRLVPRMGLANLLDAMRIMRAKMPDLQLMIAGHGSLRAELERQIEVQGLSGNVRMLGFVSDDTLPLLYAAADLSVVPTVALEGFGLIAAESLAAGTPCLVSPVGGLPEVVSGLSPELVLPSPAPADIAEGVLAALNGGLNLPDSAACRAYAAASFNWNTIAGQIASVYRLATA